LVGALRSDDRAGLLTFSDVVTVRERLTRDLRSVRHSLGGITGEGQTALRDATQLALAAAHDSDARPMMLLFTDGADNASWLTEGDILESAPIGNRDSRRADLAAGIGPVELDGAFGRRDWWPDVVGDVAARSRRALLASAG
jgi:Mg-chelatase subunit ChlD